MNDSFARLRARSGLGALCVFAVLVAGAASLRGELKIETPEVKKIAGELPANPEGLGRPITDRTAWDHWAKDTRFRSVVRNAEALAKQPVPAVPDDLYLDFSKTGNRARCERVFGERLNRLVTFTLAECLEDRGRFLTPLTQTIEAICAEKSWVYPAHDAKLDNFYGRTVEMDLRATLLGWDLVTAAYVLGDKLPAATRQMIRDNVRRRVLLPYRDMIEGRRPEIHWLRGTHNWNAVCLAGVTGAALALEDSPEDRAWFVAAAQNHIQFFLKSFTPDGYCSEGLSYWNYGFGNYLMLNETIREATGGHVDLLADPAALAPALFCRRTEILNGIYPTISDCHPGTRPDRRFVEYLRERLGPPDTNAPATDLAGPAGSLHETMLFTFLPEPLPRLKQPATEPDSPLRTWFKDGGVLISRPAPESKTQFAVCLKGGHNAENHNHNDVGSFSVVAGRAMVICDPGGEIYTARTFSSRRYESKVINSFGHAVPVVAGKLQRTGAAARAVIERAEFHDDEDVLVLNIASAYAVPELKRLERTFEFRRKDPAALTVRDEVEFGAPKSFETALITWGTVKKLSDAELLITEEAGAVRVTINTGGKAFTIREEILDEDVPTPAKPRRLGIALDAPVTQAAITLVITPEGK